MFPTANKDRTPVGPGRLEEFVAAFTDCPLPVVAIGGITADNVGQLVEHGATCVAVCGAINSADDPQAAAAAIKEKLT